MEIKKKDWEAVFAGSKINGAPYEEPPAVKWKWPEDTWLQRRRAELAGKDREENGNKKS